MGFSWVFDTSGISSTNTDHTYPPKVEHTDSALVRAVYGAGLYARRAEIIGEKSSLDKERKNKISFCLKDWVGYEF